MHNKLSANPNKHRLPKALLAVIGALAITLSGCTGEAQPRETVTVTAPAPTVETTTPDNTPTPESTQSAVEQEPTTESGEVIISGHIDCGDEPFVGAWNNRGEGSGWVKRYAPDGSNESDVSTVVAVGVAVGENSQNQFDVGCGGTPENWAKNIPVKPVVFDSSNQTFEITCHDGRCDIHVN